MKKFLPLIIIFSLIISIYPIWMYGEALSFEQARNRNETIRETDAKLEELKILNPHSSPQAGQNWEVSFKTQGTADLTITPLDQATIDDLDFVSLRCGEEVRQPQMLENLGVYYPDWSCNETGELTHLVNVSGTHTLKFQFGDQIKYAYNSPGWVSPTGHVDDSGYWVNPTNTYDNDTGTYGRDGFADYLELTLTSPISCDKIQIWIGNNDYVDVDVYYNNGWNNIHSGAIGLGEWKEVSIGSTETVSKARVRGEFGIFLYVYEFDFNEVCIAEMCGDTYRVWQSSINVGGYGGSQISTSYHLRETIGEIATGISTSTLYKLFAGYQPMQEVYLALSAPSQVSMSPSIGGVTGGQSNGTATTTVITDSPSGYSLSVRASSSPAMATSSYSFADYIPASAGTPDYTWSIPATTSEFGFTSEGSDIVQKFLDDGSSACNTGSSETTDACWYNFSTSDETIAQTYSANHPNGTQTIIKFKAESGTSNVQAPGEYQATITITAIPN